MTEILRVEHLKKYFPIRSSWWRIRKDEYKAVDDISFSTFSGQILGVIGGSGSGKTTALKTASLLLKPTGGHIYYRKEEITSLRGKSALTVRKNIQMISQNPLSSLNPRISIGSCIKEAILFHHLASSDKEGIKMAKKALQQVGIADSLYTRYPHELSGGQQQRVCIARAICLHPELLICDEALSSLDLGVQSQILHLLMTLKKEMNLAIIFVSHDLSVVEKISDQVIVMQSGCIVEKGTACTLLHFPQHPYTQALVSSRLKNYPALQS